ncbi:MAG TPA: aminoglycoside phosphotransferase family protein, partial [Chthonomonadales bacterium]|nr:aminoglycoside phosphotransferase family protein [Chthonomonadales bacterium]
MIGLHGEDGGGAWLERLPAILASCEERWNLKVSAPFLDVSFHYVVPARRADGTGVVVKACSPTDEFHHEKEALQCFDGHGMARLLDYDDVQEVLLLEYLQPGKQLSTLEDDEEATSHAAAVMSELWRPAPQHHSFQTVQDWGEGFNRLRQHYNGGNGPFRPALLEEAETLFAELSATMSEPVLLHGDLHHFNILSAQRSPWLAIDPKGLIGERAYETGSLLRNPYPELLDYPEPGRVLARRIDQLSEELGFDRARIRNWAVAQAVLSAWWGIEDFGATPMEMMAISELLAAIKR